MSALDLPSLKQVQEKMYSQAFTTNVRFLHPLHKYEKFVYLQCAGLLFLIWALSLFPLLIVEHFTAKPVSCKSVYSYPMPK